MSRYLFSLLIGVMLFPVVGFAQQDSIAYFKDKRLTTNVGTADFYRVIGAKNGDTFSYTEHHKDGTWIKASGKGNIAGPVKIGDEIYYYKSGQVAIINQYKNGRLARTTGYYPNGVLLQVLMFRNGSPDRLVAYDADSSGNVHIKDGNGIRQETDSIVTLSIKEYYTREGPYKDGLKEGLWKGTDDRGFVFEETYASGKFVSGVTKTPAGKKYRYTQLYEYPQFNGGVNKFESHIVPALKNVADTTGLRFLKGGYIQLSYIIDEEGKVVSITGFTKQGRTPFDLELKSSLPKNEPAKLRGVPIAYPITNNGDVFVRHNFAPIVFQTDLYLKGTIKLGSSK